jgi:hypothetical protein
MYRVQTEDMTTDAAFDPTEVFDYLGHSFRWEPQTKPASRLSQSDRMADGAIILRLSFQIDRVYAQVVVPGTASVRTRRYRYDQTVKLLECVPA